MLFALFLDHGIQFIDATLDLVAHSLNVLLQRQTMQDFLIKKSCGADAYR